MSIQGFACIACGHVNFPRGLSAMTVERIYPDTDRDREVEALKREVEALKREIEWLRETHRHMIDQLVASHELVPPPTPTFIPDPQPRTTVSVTLDAARVEQLLAIEKAAQDIVNPETRQRARQGHGSDITSVANSQFAVLAYAVLNVPKDPV